MAAIRITIAVYTLILCALGVLGNPIADGDATTAENLRLTKHRLRHRRTVDGRLCAAAFVYEERRYTDCAKSVAPDGSVGREWCFVEAQFKTDNSPPEWNYCRPFVDYEALREISQDILKERFLNIKTLLSKLTADKDKQSILEQRFNEVCNVRLKELEQERDDLVNHLSVLDTSKQEVENLESTLLRLKSETAALEQELQHMSTRALNSPVNCLGVRGYENEFIADGLMAEFYDNPYFMEDPVATRVDSMIDFTWFNESPAPNVSGDNFSVRWSGYISVPSSDTYVFKVKSSCGSRLYIGDKLVLLDRLPDVSSSTDSNENHEPSSVEQVTDIIKSHKATLLPMPVPPGSSAISEPVYLTGGQRIRIKLETVHSTRLLYGNYSTAFVQLYWSVKGSDDFQLVDRNFLFKRNFIPTLRISELDPLVSEPVKVYKGTRLFSDRQDLFLGDVPSYLIGSTLIRSSYELPFIKKLSLNEDHGNNSADHDEAGDDIVNSAKTGRHTVKVHLRVNVASDLYIAYTDEIPIVSSENDFSSVSNDLIGVYQVIEIAMPAQEVTYYKLSKTLVQADYNTNYEFSSIAPFILFVKPALNVQKECSGVVKKLSDPTETDSLFKACTTTSQADKNHACEFAFNSVDVDAPYGMWKTAVSGLGQSVTLYLRNRARLISFKYIPPTDPAFWPQELTLRFSDSLKGPSYIPAQSFSVIFTQAVQFIEYTLEPVIADTVTIEVSGVYINDRQVGGKFEIYGTSCDDASAKEESSKSSLPALLNNYVQTIDVNECTSSLNSLSDLSGLNFDLSARVNCIVACSADVISGKPKVWGTNIYSYESSLCYSAIHAGVCQFDSTCTFDIVFLKHNSMLIGSLKNGVRSYNQESSSISFVVNPTEKLNSIIPSNPKVPDDIIVFFGNKKAPAISGNQRLLTDDGILFSEDRNELYSHYWLRPPIKVQCASHKGAPYIFEGTNTLRPGLIFQYGKNDPECRADASLCMMNGWKIHLKPKTYYNVSVSLGNECDQSKSGFIYNLSINKTSVVKNQRIKGGEKYFATLDHVQTDSEGNIILTSPCNGKNCAEARTSILSASFKEV